MTDTIRVLIIEDFQTDAEMEKREVEKALPGSEFLCVETREDFLDALESFKPDLILSDYKLPRFDGMSALKLARELVPETPFIVITGSLGEETAVEFMRAGAWDYVIKERMNQLGSAVLNGMERKRLKEEKRQATEALEQKTEELDQFFNVTLDLLCIADTDGYFRHLNRAWEKTLGYSREELLSRKFLDFVHPDDQAGTLEAIATLSSQREVVGFINRYRCKDNSYRWIQWSSAPSGKLIYASARDITGRKEAEEELAKYREHLEELVKERTTELVHKNAELERMNKIFIGRELRMIELKEKIKELEKKIPLQG